MNVCIYVEGGGGKRRGDVAIACRQGFRSLFDKLLGNRSKPRIVASGSRNDAHDDFCRAMKDPNILPVLLVDSEDRVPAGKSAKTHLRDSEGWNGHFPEGQVYLMVQCMEAWFLADAHAVVLYYNNEFQQSALKSNRNIEEIPKADVLRKLKAATRSTSKGLYQKDWRSFEILGRIDPKLVGERSKHADALFRFLVAKSR